MRRRLAYSTNGFARVSLVEAVEQIAALGYGGVELLADHPHWAPGDSPAAVVAMVRRTGIAVSNVNANTALALWPQPPSQAVFEPALSNLDPQIRQRRVLYTLAAMDLAQAVGASCVSVTSGSRDDSADAGARMDVFADTLSALCVEAAARGLRLGIEYEPGLLVERAAEVAWLIDRVDHPALGANLDIGHAVCIGEDPTHSVATLAGRIWNVHVEDIAGTTHHHLIPGEGDIDFCRVFDALDRSGYDGYLTVELYTCSDRAQYAARLARERLLALPSPPSPSRSAS